MDATAKRWRLKRSPISCHCDSAPTGTAREVPCTPSGSAVSTPGASDVASGGDSRGSESTMLSGSLFVANPWIEPEQEQVGHQSTQHGEQAEHHQHRASQVGIFAHQRL